MPRFMMLMYPNVTEEQYEEGVRAEDAGAMSKFNQTLIQAGVLLALDGLHPASKGARVTLAGGKPTITDGPFTEAKELVGGYWIWDCASREEALEWLKRAPFDAGTVIELRQVFEADDFGDALTPELREAQVRLREQTAQN